MGLPWSRVTRTSSPSSAWAAVAPSNTSTSGRTSASSDSTQGRQAPTSSRFGRSWSRRLLPGAGRHLKCFTTLVTKTASRSMPASVERLVEESSGRPDERLSLEVLVIARLFADEHPTSAERDPSRRPSASRVPTGHRPCTGPPRERPPRCPHGPRRRRPRPRQVGPPRRLTSQNATWLKRAAHRVSVGPQGRRPPLQTAHERRMNAAPLASTSRVRGAHQGRDRRGEGRGPRSHRGGTERGSGGVCRPDPRSAATASLRPPSGSSATSIGPRMPCRTRW